MQPPEHLEDPPAIEARFMVFWEAYRDLQTERVHARATIPFSAIAGYARQFGLEVDQLKRIVWAVDAVLLEHWKGLDKTAENKQKAESAQRTSLGAQQ